MLQQILQFLSQKKLIKTRACRKFHRAVPSRSIKYDFLRGPTL